MSVWVGGWVGVKGERECVWMIASVCVSECKLDSVSVLQAN